MLEKTVSFLLFIFLISINGCTQENKWQGTQEVRDGVLYVKNPDKGLWDDSHKMVLTEMTSIGVEDGNEDYILASIHDLQVDEEGNIYICDFLDNCVKVYDQNGKFLRRIGNKGQGPGELFGPGKIAISPNNKIYIIESGNMRISLFNLYGDFISSFYFSGTPFDMICDPSGNLIISYMIFKFYNLHKKELRERLFDIYNENGNLIDSFGKPTIFAEHPKAIYYSSVILEKNERNFVFTYVYPYKIDFYDFN